MNSNNHIKIKDHTGLKSPSQVNKSHSYCDICKCYQLLYIFTLKIRYWTYKMYYLKFYAPKRDILQKTSYFFKVSRKINSFQILLSEFFINCKTDDKNSESCL